MNTAVINFISYCKGKGVVENKRRMSQSTAKLLMSSLFEQFKEGGYTLLKVVKVNDMYHKFNALLVKDGKPVEYHYFEVEL